MRSRVLSGFARPEMRISSIQQGLIVQFEFAKYLMMGSGGRLELNPPMTDDDRRDAEIHERGKFGFALATQIKSAMQLHRMSASARYLYILFDVAADRLVSSPFFYYLLAYLNPKTMRLADPTYVIPSEDFHRLAAPRLRNEAWHFTMAASMELEAHDKWHMYRVNTLDLGQHVLGITRGLARNHKGIVLPSEIVRSPGVYWVRPTTHEWQRSAQQRARLSP